MCMNDLGDAALAGRLSLAPHRLISISRGCVVSDGSAGMSCCMKNTQTVLAASCIGIHVYRAAYQDPMSAVALGGKLVQDMPVQTSEVI